MKVLIFLLLLVLGCTVQDNEIDVITGRAIQQENASTTANTIAEITGASPSTSTSTTIISQINETKITNITASANLTCKSGKTRKHIQNGSIVEVCWEEKYIRECSKHSDCGRDETCINELCRPI